ncbi:hypothetical protein BDY19DRAFT_395124 [Irpex rosettiformis]|uniref:Uncharacterized protein n=1 Tax=Irpex rosettiformis TaxID=378272 RepID=A0ACB8TV76_9APHY|nr:hypothetical protein BDY19DRAFT_395124 [Irpex rosettiformis]
MSVSPQPHPHHPPLSRSPPDISINNAPVPSLSHATNPTADSPAQLASLLSDALHQVETLKRDLSVQKRRAEKAERLLSNYQKISPATDPSSPENPASASTFDEGAARLLILECEARVERAELERTDLEARIARIQAQWAEDERILFDAESKLAEVRNTFSQIITHRGGQLVVVNGQGPHAAVQLANMRVPEGGRPSHHTLSVRTTGTSSRSGIPLSAQPSGSVAQSSSRVRPRAGSLDGSYSTLTGPGGPPPAKRARSDRNSDRDLQVPPGITYAQSNGQPDPVVTNPIGSPYGQHVNYRPRSRTEDGVQIRYTDATGQISHRSHRGRREHGAGSRSKSRSRSRASSASLDEMLLEATTGDEGNLIVAQQRLAMQGAQHLSPHVHGARTRHRSPSGGEEYLVARSRVPQGPGVPGNLPGNQIQTYQTHIFAPPVTGAPVKKAPTAGIITGTSSIGQGGYPPTNPQGQRICRQCGHAGRYKDGKCVEKWGPGPEGPGTVCDRCRKKMKRVERRGTLESQQLANAHNGPAAVHPSAAALQHPPLNGRGQHINIAQVHRTDTLPAQHMSSTSSRTITSQPTHILAGSSYREDRPPASPHTSGPGVPPGRVSQNRSPVTPPEIATLPSTSTNDTTDAEPMIAAVPRLKSPRVLTPQPLTIAPELIADVLRPSSVTNGQGVKAVLGGEGDAATPKNKPVIADADGDADADADAEADVDAEADIDADADADADAELLEAVDAAEANNASSDGSLKKED